MLSELSRPLDVNRWSDYPELQKCLSRLIYEIEDWEKRKRQRKDDEVKRLREAVRCIALDLYVAWKTDPSLQVGINLSKSHYSNTSRYRALFLGYSSFRAAYDGLCELGYLRVIKRGLKDRTTDKGFVTRIRATERLIQLLTDQASLSIPAISSRVSSDTEVILLRDGLKKPVEYEDTDETRSMSAALQRINAHLQAQWIDIRITDSEFRKLQRRMRRDYEDEDRERPFIDFTQRALVRIFNNGDWQQGGRFYRGWWQSVPKEYRRFITINGKRTVEIDYSSFHPTLMYAEMGAMLEGKAYELPDWPDIPEKLVKTTFNAMVNTKRQIRKPPEFDSYGVGLSWKEFQQAIAERHKPIASFFKTGHGLWLQRHDADIAQQVMLRFIEMGYACLPVHDSFLVHHALDTELKQIMIEELYSATGRSITVKTKMGIDPTKETGLVTSDIETILNKDDGYKGYNSRWEDWLKLQ